MKDTNIKYLDNEEKELIEAYNLVDLSKAKKPSDHEQELFKEAAKNYLKQESKMNIRIDTYELNQIKKRAKHEGLKYSTFVKMVLHKYLTGQLVESR